MRNWLLQLFILLMIVAPVAQGQDGEFAPCTSADHAMIVERKSGYDALMRQAPRTINTNLLRYLAERQYEWRLGINDDLPRCAQAIEIGWLMSQITGDAVAASALTLSEKNTVGIAESIEAGTIAVGAALRRIGCGAGRRCGGAGLRNGNCLF